MGCKLATGFEPRPFDFPSLELHGDLFNVSNINVLPFNAVSNLKTKEENMTYLKTEWKVKLTWFKLCEKTNVS